MVRLSIEERQEQYEWAMTTLRYGETGNRRALHATLHQQENAVIDLLKPEDQERFRRMQ